MEAANGFATRFDGLPPEMQRKIVGMQIDPYLNAVVDYTVLRNELNSARSLEMTLAHQAQHNPNGTSNDSIIGSNSGAPITVANAYNDSLTNRDSTQLGQLVTQAVGDAGYYLYDKFSPDNGPSMQIADHLINQQIRDRNQQAVEKLRRRRQQEALDAQLALAAEEQI